MAKQLSERFGKIMKDRESISINRTDTSISKSKQFDAAVPPSRIASLSSGEFVGTFADHPDCKIELKTFRSQIQNNVEKLKTEEAAYKEMPAIRRLSDQEIQDKYLQVKLNVQLVMQAEMENLRL